MQISSTILYMRKLRMIKSIAITSLCGGQEVLREFKKEKNISVNKIDADSLDAQIV